MKPDRELLLQIKSGENHYKQFYVDSEYDNSESIFSMVKETINQIIKKIDSNATLPEIQELFRKRFIKTGWNTFLKDMEYVRPKNPENELHDSINKMYYNQIGKAIGLDNFETYLLKPKTNIQTISKIHGESISKLKVLEQFHDKLIVSQIEKAFKNCFESINNSQKTKFNKAEVLRHFEILLLEILEFGIEDTEDREVIAEIIQDCLISFGFEDSDGLLEKYI